MRGKAKHTHAFQFRHRITPACAGKRLCLTCVLAILWDHPRMCGEKWLARFKPFATRGSPPHVRGKGVVHILVPEPLGITPAYAGKSVHLQAAYACREDHPRVCGEKENVKNACRGHLGSPPRMRGKARGSVRRLYFARITPAYAGKRATAQYMGHLQKDHPRVCGEKEARQWPKERVWGSPPRMRGKGIVPCIQRRLIGITPAYAGKSFQA